MAVARGKWWEKIRDEGQALVRHVVGEEAHRRISGEGGEAGKPASAATPTIRGAIAQLLLALLPEDHGDDVAAILQRLPKAHRRKLIGFAEEARRRREDEVVADALWAFLEHFPHEKKVTKKTVTPGTAGIVKEKVVTTTDPDTGRPVTTREVERVPPVPASEKTEETVERDRYTDPSGHLGDGFTPREAAFIKLLDDHASYESFRSWTYFVHKDGKVQGILRIGGKAADAIADSANRAEASYKEYRRLHPRRK